MKHRWWKGLIGFALLWNVWACVRIHPHHLAFFNEASGGSDNGHWHLLDANVDWGEANLALKHWQDEREQQVGYRESFYLSCFGVDCGMKLEDLGLHGQPVPMKLSPETKMNQSLPISELPPGLYAISVNHLHGYRHHKTGDPDRVCLTGVSGYGAGVWELASAHLELFAALWPISTRCSADLQQVIDRNTPVWSFYNPSDRRDLVDSARNAHQSLLQGGLSPIVTLATSDEKRDEVSGHEQGNDDFTYIRPEQAGDCELHAEFQLKEVATCVVELLDSAGEFQASVSIEIPSAGTGGSCK